jgi:predicted DNA-binding transcriptional regulator AlpA
MPGPSKKAIPLELELFDKLPDAAAVDQKVVEGLLGVSPATIWRWVQAGILPEPERFPGARSTRWNVGRLRKMLNERTLQEAGAAKSAGDVAAIALLLGDAADTAMFIGTVGKDLADGRSLSPADLRQVFAGAGLLLRLAEDFKKWGDGQ